PQIVLASMWIACAYRDQALDPKDFVRAASKTARERPITGYVLPRRVTRRLPRCSPRLSTDCVGKRVDSLRIPRPNA
ncbi:hypothetical protein, partial [Burkholderia cenocepacia]|uniref:hypothetical protein n=1 Tax=Burkholderia cenocepacia TaxID=95486 RepID=UPI001C4E2056